MSEKRKANKAFKKAQKYSRQQARNNVPSRYRPMDESKGCAIALIVGVGLVFTAISGLVYAVASVL